MDIGMDLKNILSILLRDSFPVKTYFSYLIIIFKNVTNL